MVLACGGGAGPTRRCLRRNQRGLNWAPGSILHSWQMIHFGSKPSSLSPLVSATQLTNKTSTWAPLGSTWPDWPRATSCLSLGPFGLHPHGPQASLAVPHRDTTTCTDPTWLSSPSSVCLLVALASLFLCKEHRWHCHSLPTL